MRENTYIKFDRANHKYRGYINTLQLIDEGFSNRQIKTLVEEKYLERVCHGYYWMKQCGYDKPNDYKCIEVSFSNPKAVICLESACYYEGLIKEEPNLFSVATSRTDRSAMKVNFELDRHYFIERYFEIAKKKINTEFGNYNVFEAERSVCDMLRLNREVPVEIISYKDTHTMFQHRLFRYAEFFGMNL